MVLQDIERISGLKSARKLRGGIARQTAFRSSRAHPFHPDGGSKMRLKFTLPILGAAMVFAAAPVQAQCSVPPGGGSCPLTHALRASVTTVASLNLSTPASTINVTAADFTAGSNSTTGPTLDVKANPSWTVSVHGPANWNGPSGTSKPVSTITVNAVNVSTTATALANGTATAGATTPTTLVTTWGYITDPPGVYDITLTFTLTAP